MTRRVGGFIAVAIQFFTLPSSFFTQNNPRCTGFCRKAERACAAVEHVDVVILVEKGVEHRQREALVVVVGIVVALHADAHRGLLFGRYALHPGQFVLVRHRPFDVAYVLVLHHVLPFSAGKGVVIICRKPPVALEKAVGQRRPGIGRGPALPRIKAVARCGGVHTGHARRCHDGVINQLEVSVLVIAAELRLHAPGLFFKLQPKGVHAVGLAVVHDTEHSGRLHLGLAQQVVLRVTVNKPRDVVSAAVAERLCGPLPGVQLFVAGLYRVRVPGVTHDEVDGKLFRLEVANVDYPQVVDARMVSQRELFAQLRNGCGSHPAVVPRAAVHIYVVVKPHSALAPTFLCRAGAAQVAPVVVAEEQQNVVGHGEALVVITLHLGEDGPQLGHFRGVAAVHLLYYVTLSGHHVAQDGHVLGVASVAHGHVAVAAHAYGYYVVVSLVALKSCGEEAVKTGFVGGVVPFSHLVSPPCVFLVGAHHRLVVARSHYDAVHVGHLGVKRVVLVEGRVPHGRPEVVGLQAQEQLEKVGVHLGVKPSEARRGPSPERGPLVVYEDAAVLYLGRRLYVAAFPDVERRALARRNVGPPVPWRHADFLGYVVNSVYCAALVAACHNEVAVHRLDDERLPAATYAVNVELSGLYKSVNQGAFAYRADDD